MEKGKIITALLLICSLSCSGQACKNTPEPPATKGDSKELVQKVENLEHELIYLRSSYDLFKIQTDFGFLLNDIKHSINDLSKNIYHDNYHYNTCKIAEKHYDLLKEKISTLRKLYESIKSNVEIYSQKNSFSESEEGSLRNCCNSIDSTITSICGYYGYLDFYKETIDLYKDVIKKKE